MSILVQKFIKTLIYMHKNTNIDTCIYVTNSYKYGYMQIYSIINAYMYKFKCMYLNAHKLARVFIYIYIYINIFVYIYVYV
jgi:hypothetical protein